jgi:hypothetical protein
LSKSGVMVTPMVTTRSKRGTLRSCGKSCFPALACYPRTGHMNRVATAMSVVLAGPVRLGRVKPIIVNSNKSFRRKI